MYIHSVFIRNDKKKNNYTKLKRKKNAFIEERLMLSVYSLSFLA